jgi:prepilin-type N-terminal cleavage/methylation domain-containing protein
MLMKMRSKMQRTNNQKGFTLVELMVVVVIIGILVAIAIPVYNNVTAKANRGAVEANLRTLDGAISQYGAVNDQAVPDQTQLAPYLKVWPTGPDGVTYTVPSGVATATKGTGTKDWFTGTSQTLPISW